MKHPKKQAQQACETCQTVEQQKVTQNRLQLQARLPPSFPVHSQRRWVVLDPAPSPAQYQPAPTHDAVVFRDPKERLEEKHRHLGIKFMLSRSVSN